MRCTLFLPSSFSWKPEEYRVIITVYKNIYSEKCVASLLRPPNYEITISRLQFSLSKQLNLILTCSKFLPSHLQDFLFTYHHLEKNNPQNSRDFINRCIYIHSSERPSLWISYPIIGELQWFRLLSFGVIKIFSVNVIYTGLDGWDDLLRFVEGQITRKNLEKNPKTLIKILKILRDLNLCHFFSSYLPVAFCLDHTHWRRSPVVVSPRSFEEFY